VTFPTQAQTNIYYPLPTSNTVWREYTGGLDCGPCCLDYQEFITGDTVIGGNIYQKIQRSGVTLSTNSQGACTNNIWYVFNYYAGAYRNDSINKKVYFVPPSALSDTLLYDFNLNLGDALHQSYLYDSTYWGGVIVVTGIDSVIIGSKYHKRFLLYGNPFMMGLIEGIGFTSGLLTHIYFAIGCSTELVCVSENGVPVYPGSTGNCGFVSVEQEKVNNPQVVSIIPNPVLDFANINFLSVNITVNISIMDILGNEKLRFERLKNGDKMNLTKLQPGLYLYKVVLNNEIISTGKMVKLN
jgi:hypothetical protein